jgi:serine/threonine-protein kinase
VPAPRNSAQHASAAMHRSHMQAQQATTGTTARPPARPVLAPRQHTRELTREDWLQPQELEYEPVSGQFAGIDIDEFYWARQRARRALLFWVVAVLTLTGLIAAAAWTLGGNIGTLI